MPIYEYLCLHCNRIYSFMAKSYREVNAKQPACPRCGANGLKRQISPFSVGGNVSKSQGERKYGGDDNDAMLDDPRMEREMNKLMREAENLDENDPRQLGGLMRQMSEISGEKMTPEIAEAVRRLENGEAPEKIEEDMAELLDGDEEIAADGAASMGSSPVHDGGLYPL